MAHCRSSRQSLNRDLKRGALGPPRPSVVVAAYGEQPQQIYAAAPAQPVPVQEGAYAAMK